MAQDIPEISIVCLNSVYFIALPLTRQVREQLASLKLDWDMPPYQLATHPLRVVRCE